MANVERLGIILEKTGLDFDKKAILNPAVCKTGNSFGFMIRYEKQMKKNKKPG